MSSTKYNLLMIAHPDDETIFFSGLLLRRRARPWKIICATDGNADGQGKRRRRQFERATGLLGVRDTEWWGFTDKFSKRLPVEELTARLSALPTPHEVFTHGVIGEYMHPHHQDVSLSVHRAFAGHPRVYSAAYNAFPELRVHLDKKEFELKAKLLTDIYGSETTRFLNLLPATSSEGFFRARLEEIEAIYEFNAGLGRLDRKRLHAYAWMADYLATRPMKKRLF
jgi:LmbE family N-acetylglucosaminyl deacetylase